MTTTLLAEHRNEGIDCLLRFHNILRIKELERAVFSLVTQFYRPLNIIVILQRFSAEEKKIVEDRLSRLLIGPDAPGLAVYNFTEPEPEDARSELLNLGLRKCTGRYLAFLDYDDVLFPEAYTLLANRLRESGAGIVFAKVLLMKVTVFQDYVYYTGASEVNPFNGCDLWDLFWANFCPIHSYLIDRSQFSKHHFFFDTQLCIEEDYDLLLRLCALRPSDFSMIDVPVGYYNCKDDGSNTVAGGQLGPTELEKLSVTRSRIEQRKKTVPVSLEVQRQLQVKEPREGKVIQEILAEKKFRWRGGIRRMVG